MTLRAIAGALIALALLGGCSTYSGEITNAPPPAGGQGPPLLTEGYAP
ncbi:hypothetical protein [Lichenicoccus sp.]